MPFSAFLSGPQRWPLYQGKWRLQDCAIKELPKERMGEKELQEFREECALMASIRPHRNLVTFLGVSMDEGDWTALALREDA
jgi:hypothetical protein